MAVQRIAQPQRRVNQTEHATATPRRIREAALADDGIAKEGEIVPMNLDRRGDAMAIASFETNDPEALVSEIGGLWRRAQEEFLVIGRCLINARDLVEQQIRRDNAIQSMAPFERRALAEAEWKKFLDRLPFSAGIASQLERVARALSSNRLTREDLPQNYSVAYQLTTLTDAELDAARREGVVGITATRSRIIEFKRRLRQKRLAVRELIELRRHRVLSTMERLRTELAALDQELAKAKADEGAPPDGGEV